MKFNQSFKKSYRKDMVEKKQNRKFNQRPVCSSPYSCWKCGTAMTVSYIPGVWLWDKQQVVNICPNQECNAVQGMWFLVMEPDGPFFRSR